MAERMRFRSIVEQARGPGAAVAAELRRMA